MWDGARQLGGCSCTDLPRSAIDRKTRPSLAFLRHLLLTAVPPNVLLYSCRHIDTRRKTSLDCRSVQELLFS